MFDFTHSSLFIPVLYVSEYIKNIARTSRKFYGFLMNPSVSMWVCDIVSDAIECVPDMCSICSTCRQRRTGSK